MYIAGKVASSNFFGFFFAIYINCMYFCNAVWYILCGRHVGMTHRKVLIMKRCAYRSNIVMLGIKTRRVPIEGDIANDIRNAVARVANGQLSAQDKAVVRRAKAALDRYDIHWEL